MILSKKKTYSRIFLINAESYRDIERRSLEFWDFRPKIGKTKGVGLSAQKRRDKSGIRYRKKAAAANAKKAVPFFMIAGAERMMASIFKAIKPIVII